MRLQAFETGRRILVVDDTTASRYSTTRVLRAAGFEVVEAVSGEDALAMLEGIDLVVLDINLPGIDGFEVCRRIRASPDTASLPVVHLSATYVNEHDRAEGYNVGADGYLTHPVEPPVLVGTINAFLRTRRAESERRAVEMERERLLERERAARAEAERANALKDQFLAMLSHELRNPLNAIIGWAEVLRTRYSQPDVQKGLGIITDAAWTQAQLIADLLDVSRVTSGKLHLEFKPVDLARIAAAAVQATEATARAKDIRVDMDVDVDAGNVEGDAVRLQQVVWNLLHNAVKFTPVGGHIAVTLRRRERAVELVVRDSGAGISPQFLPHVFATFRQGDEGTRKSHAGLGLGLAIVKFVVEGHGGSVDAASAGPGQGATFTVAIPLTEARPSDEAPVDDDVGASAFDGARVLVVENEPASREIVMTLFADLGADVVGAESVDEALAHLADRAVDLIVSDIGMPGRDGFDLITAVRKGESGDAHVPAIALTAFAAAEDRRQVLAAGFDRHIPKPIDRRQLLGAARELLARRVSLSPLPIGSG